MTIDPRDRRGEEVVRLTGGLGADVSLSAPAKPTCNRLRWSARGQCSSPRMEPTTVTPLTGSGARYGCGIVQRRRARLGPFVSARRWARVGNRSSQCRFARRNSDAFQALLQPDQLQVLVRP